MLKLFLSFLFLFSCLCLSAERPTLENALNRRIHLNNTIVAKVNGKTLSLFDVSRKLDYLLYQTNREALSSDASKYQFYLSSWRYALIETINTELMLAEAESKEVKVQDSEIKEEMQKLFGPNIASSLESLSLSYDEAFQLVKNEEIAKRIRWFFIHAKALQKVTPEMIRQSYEAQLGQKPSGDLFHFQILTIDENDEAAGSALALKISEFLRQTPKVDPGAVLKAFPEEKIKLSTPYSLALSELSELYRSALISLKEGEYSTPISQISRQNGQIIWRLFHLQKKEFIAPPSFQASAEKIKNELLQKTVNEESAKYFEKLYRKYSVDDTALNKLLSNELFSPFSLQ
ncbi:MAG: hypothetical protein WC371_02470 [Parachlamydiales bacterium]|jgi:hypothetical protein